MKAIQGEINLDDVQKLMDDTEEAKAYQDVSYLFMFVLDLYLYTRQPNEYYLVLLLVQCRSPSHAIIIVEKVGGSTLF